MDSMSFLFMLGRDLSCHRCDAVILFLFESPPFVSAVGVSDDKLVFSGGCLLDYRSPELPCSSFSLVARLLFTLRSSLLFPLSQSSSKSSVDVSVGSN